MGWERWAGVLLVFVASYGLGEMKAARTRHRVAELEDFCPALRLLSAEIGYTSTPLPRALVQVASRLQRKPVRDFFLLAGEMLNGEGRLAEAALSWAAAEERQRAALALTGEDWAALLRGAAGLGCCHSASVRRLKMYGLDVELIFRIAGIGIFISVLAIVLKQAGKEEQAQMLTLGGVVVVLLMLIQLISELFADIRTIFNLF